MIESILFAVLMVLLNGIGVIASIAYLIVRSKKSQVIQSNPRSIYTVQVKCMFCSKKCYEHVCDKCYNKTRLGKIQAEMR